MKHIFVCKECFYPCTVTITNGTDSQPAFTRCCVVGRGFEAKFSYVGGSQSVPKEQGCRDAVAVELDIIDLRKSIESLKGLFDRHYSHCATSCPSEELKGMHEEIDWCTHKCQEIDGLIKRQHAFVESVNKKLCQYDEYIEGAIRRVLRKI